MTFPLGSPSPGQRRQPIHGVVLATVTNNQDDKKLGRVKLKFPWRSSTLESDWAPVVTPMSGDQFGLFLLPEVNDQVLVVFERGDINKPYVIGALWSSKVKPPADNSDGKNNLRMLKSRSGHVIQLDDTDQSEKIVITDKDEKNKIQIDHANNTITITSDKDFTVDAKGDVTLKGKNIILKADQKVSIEAQQEIDIKCMAGVKINTDGLVVT
jgi:uncharacterized protein involved in type VI secretion and phage assembly